MIASGNSSPDFTPDLPLPEPVRETDAWEGFEALGQDAINEAMWRRARLGLACVWINPDGTPYLAPPDEVMEFLRGLGYRKAVDLAEKDRHTRPLAG